MKRGIIIIIIIMVLIGLAFHISKTTVGWYENPGNSDFFTFWLSGRLVINGLDPYSSTNWLQGHYTYHSTWIVNQAFVYPLPLAVLLSPLGLLDLKSAFTFWVFLTIISLFISIALSLRYFGSTKNHFVLPIIAGLLIFRPLTSLLLNGQISGLLLLVTVLAVLLLEKKQWFWGGVLFALTLVKPQLGGILVLLAGWYFLRHKKYSALAGIGACGITLFLLGFAINPNWVLEFFSILLTKYNQTFGYNPTIWGLTFYITGFRFTSAMAIGATVTISLLILYVYLVWHTRSLTPAEVIGLAIPVTLLVTPYIWPYDQILLLFPIVQIMVMMKNLQVKYLGSSMFFIGISISSYILYAFTVRIEMENLNALLSLIVLASLLSVFWFNNKTRMLDLENKVLQKR